MSDPRFVLCLCVCVWSVFEYIFRVMISLFVSMEVGGDDGGERVFDRCRREVPGVKPIYSIAMITQVDHSIISENNFSFVLLTIILAKNNYGIRFTQACIVYFSAHSQTAQLQDVYLHRIFKIINKRINTSNCQYI